MITDRGEVPEKGKEIIKFEDEDNQVYLDLGSYELLVFVVQGYRYQFSTRTINERTTRWLGEVVYQHLQKATLRGKRNLAKDLLNLKDSADNLLKGYLE